MAASDVLTWLGLVVLIGGLIIEFVAFAGMAFNPVRRALSVRSPLQLQETGCMTFYAGCAILVFARVFL